jgi:hypothetical protein
MNISYQNILKHLKEVMIIFIGVSISFFVDKCKNDRQDEAAAALLAQNLILDLTSDSTQLVLMCNTEVQGYHQVSLLFENIETPEKLEDSLLYHIRCLTRSTVFVPNNLTYEEIKQNGLSKLIKDIKTKRAIYDLYTNFYEDLKIVNGKTSFFIDYELSPFLNRQLPYVKGNIASPKEKQQLIALLKTNTFKNLIRSTVRNKKMNWEYYQTAFDKNKALLQLLKAK